MSLLALVRGCRRVVAGVVLMVLAHPGALAAQAAPSGRLDLAGALALARQSGPLAQLVAARRETALGRLREGSQWPNPTLEWRRENMGSPLLPDVFATLYVPLDLSGRRLALGGAVSAGRSRLDADAEAERRTAELDVAKAWMRAAVAAGTQELAARQREALREVAVVDSQRLREGLVSEAVGLRTSLEADRAHVAYVSAAADAARARVELARLLGLADDALPALAPLTAPLLPAPPDSAAVRALALRVRPEVRAREAALDEATRRVRAEQRGVLGDVQLQGGTKETGGFMTGQVGVGLPLPLFNRNGGARQRAAGELAEAQVLRRDQQLAVGGSVGAAWHVYRDIRAAAAGAATFSTRGAEVARIARVAYSEGHITLTELLDAERAASDAMLAYLRWAAEGWLSRFELERAIGARLDRDTPLDLPLLSTLMPPGF